MRSTTILATAIVGVGMPGGAAVAAPRTTYVTPYIEALQVLDVPITGGRDVLTYSVLAAGVDAGASGRRLEGTLSYRYERRFPWGGDGGVPSDTHNGIARGSFQLVPNFLTLQAGGIATRTRVDARGGGVDFLGRGNNVAQVYGGYIGPSLTTRVGALDVNASYRFGYVRTDDGSSNGDDLGTNQFGLNRYDSSVSHLANASVGMKPGQLPFGWTLSGSYSREDAKPLDQRFVNKFVRAEVLVPVAPTLALTAGVGYEDIRVSQQAVQRTAAGLPVVDSNGRFVGDRSAPRQIAYDFDGLFFDAGVIWRPSRRTTLVASVGRRYGQLAVTGSFSHQITSRSGVTIGVYNGIDSFGRSIGNNLSALPTQFSVPRNGLNNRFDGCVFGNQGTGGCFNDSLQSASTSNYRARGINALYTNRRGALTFGLGAGYDERRYLGPVLASNGISYDNVTDRSVTAQANATITLDERSSLSNQIYVGWFESGLPGADGVLTGGASSSYYRRLTDRLSGNATLAIFATDQQEYDTDITGQLLVGARYAF
ncbi:porin family protein [Sphingomonas prati]|uniref:Uncharacterized protein (PEP-CTERM system associated) n=1 Tax=Sphingomonas prati TaxID=1843237 RepID=A0A7W9BS65_9SPHN|nr:hypothetical protein [Sphingomonas prati]MBB5728603.1 uncharacterized protein (PEP-CTERM system associated) [Sphingomonas prati]GGE72502.1 hypothetical protein GCM10011404_01250 [Sphingomonas prati]